MEITEDPVTGTGTLFMNNVDFGSSSFTFITHNTFVNLDATSADQPMIRMAGNGANYGPMQTTIESNTVIDRGSNSSVLVQLNDTAVTTTVLINNRVTSSDMAFITDSGAGTRNGSGNYLRGRPQGTAE